MLPLLSHAQHGADAAEARDSQHAAALLNNVGYHFKTVADFAPAQALYERALRIFDQHLGDNHPNVATLVNNLGSVAKAQGDLPAARTYLEHALRIFEQKLGPEHPNTRTVRGNFAAVLAALGSSAVPGVPPFCGSSTEGPAFLIRRRSSPERAAGIAGTHKDIRTPRCWRRSAMIIDAGPRRLAPFLPTRYTLPNSPVYLIGGKKAMTNDNPPRAVLWDMDGTLLDSAEYHWLAWRDILHAEGYPIAYDEFKASFGQRNDTILRGYFGAGLPDTEVERVGGAKEARYRELVRERGIALLPGVGAWLARLRAAGWRQAIASAAPRANVEAIVAALDIASFFGAIVAAEDVQRGKPDPHVFLLAAERLGAPPARCVVVEDAPAGIEAAHRAGMRAVGVRTSHADLRADIVADTLDQLPEDTFDLLLRS